MSYPSLLFSDRASGVRVEPHVFEDVKLTAFFSEESVGAMRILCRPEDIPLRQELLRFLSEEPASGRTLRDLAGITLELQRLHAALQDVKCENERHYVFVGLMAAVADFAEKAGITAIHVSLSWETDYAVAFAVAERKVAKTGVLPL